MKTKHLFFAAALAASFTACTSEELVEVQQQGVATVERATVENVQLNFIGEGIDSRLTFNGEYAWEATDTIGALNMDTYVSAGATWYAKYPFTTYVNTSYPFTYNAEEGTWSCPGKMLEGNYFFAYPFSNYDGGREMKHSLLNQAQKGIAGSAVAQSLADNQFFIGYAQIKKGNAFDVLTDVEMTSVLGAVQLRIKNNGEKTYHINKIVLSGTGISSELTFNPKTASYTGEKLEGVAEYGGNFNYSTTQFNYANYVDDTEAGVNYQITEANAKYYNRANALRKVVNTTGTRNVAYLNIEGTEAERAIAPGATAYALIMVNPLSETQADAVTVTMYTDEGQAVLTTTLGACINLNGYAVEDVRPGVSTTVSLAFEDNNVVSPANFSVYTEEDLMQYIDWRKSVTTASSANISLMSDVELNAEMFNKMKGNSLVTWNFSNTTLAPKKLTLAEDLPANALDYVKMNIGANITIEVLGTVDVTADTKTRLSSKTLNIADGAKLNIKADVDGTKVILPTINNEGTVEIAAVQIKTAPAITNKVKGTIDVLAGADVKSVVTNYGKLNNNGYMENVTNSNNSAKEVAIVNLGANAVLKGLTNGTEAVVNAAAGSSVTGTNTGLIACADETVKVAVTGEGSKVALKVTGDIAKNKYENKGYNTLIIEGTTTFADVQANIIHIITTDGSELKLAEAAAGYTLSLSSLEINGATTITTVLTGTKTNKVSTTKMVVKEGATLTNNGEFVVASVTAANWKNEGLVINNEKATLPASSTVGNWKYNAANPYVAPTTHNKHSINAVFNGGDLFNSIKDVEHTTLTGLKNFDASVDEYVSLTINAELDMDASITGKTNEYNYTYKSVIADAGKVILNANIKDLKEEMGVTVSKLYVNENVTISGTKNMNILKVGYLEVAPGKLLTVEDGFLVIDETAVAGKGSEKIKLGAGAAYKGWIIAYDSDDNILCWDNVKSEWVAKDKYQADYSEASLSASTAEELAWALENGVGKITLNDNIAIAESLLFENEGEVELNLNNKKIELSVSEDHFAAIKATKGTLTLKGDGVVAGLTEGNEELSALAVWAKGTATINIEGGEYSAENGNSTIYVSEATATINISGGVFKGASQGFLLNQLNSIATQRIFVTGGEFHNFNPANADNDDTWPGASNPVNFVDSECSVKVMNVTNNQDVTNVQVQSTGKTFAEHERGKTWTDYYVYTVE